MYTYSATIVSVVDGDTIHATIDLGFDQWVNKTLRFAGINAPELPTPEGEAAKAYVEDWFQANPRFIITTIKDRKEKYGRYLATIWSDADVDPKSLNQMLIDANLAVPYMV